MSYYQRFQNWDPVYAPRSFRRQPLGNRLQDWVNLVLAIWLFISPWVLSFGSGAEVGNIAANATIAAVHRAAWNAWVLGVIVGLLAASALSRVELWQEWLCLLLGAWIFCSPWALGFTTLVRDAAWDHWVIGGLIFFVSLSNLSRLRRDPTVM